MRKVIKRVLYGILFLVAAICITGLVLSYWPSEWRIINKGITQEEAADLRQHYNGSHNLFTTSDGEALFLRRWNPETIEPTKKNIAVLIFHGFTVCGPYDMAGIPISKGGYTVFVLDCKGHGLSGGNRGDSPGKNRWIR